MQENDFKQRHDSNCITLHGLKKECDGARIHLNDKSRSNNEMQMQIAAIREQISLREAEIGAFHRDIHNKVDHINGFRHDIDVSHHELNKLKEERARDQYEIDRLRDVIAHKEHENADTDKRIKSTDYDLFKLQERAHEL